MSDIIIQDELQQEAPQVPNNVIPMSKLPVLPQKGFRQMRQPTKNELAKKAIGDIDTLGNELGILSQVVESIRNGVFALAQVQRQFQLQMSEILPILEQRFFAIHNLLLEKNVFTEDEFVKAFEKAVITTQKEKEVILDKMNGLQDAPEGRVVQIGDTVVVSYDGTLEDGTKSDLEYSYFRTTIGATDAKLVRLTSELENALVGMKVNEEKDVIMTFPDTYEVEKLRGKKATIKLKLLKIKDKITPTTPAA